MCRNLSYDLTLSVFLDENYTTLYTDANINATDYSFTELNSNTLYLVEVMPKYNGSKGINSNMNVTTKDQTSNMPSTYVCMCEKFNTVLYINS